MLAHSRKPAAKLYSDQTKQIASAESTATGPATAKDIDPAAQCSVHAMPSEPDAKLSSDSVKLIAAAGSAANGTDLVKGFDHIAIGYV